MAWIYLVLMIGGGLFLIFAWLGGVLSEAGEGVLGAIDGALEAVGIDIIPDALYEGVGGPGCGYAAATFTTFFGAVGLLTTSYFHATAAQSVTAAGVVGMLIAIVTLRTVKMVIKQEASSAPSAQDYVGARGRVSVAIPEQGVGVVIVSPRGFTERFGARSLDGLTISDGTTVEVVQKEGGILIVKPS